MLGMTAVQQHNTIVSRQLERMDQVPRPSGSSIQPSMMAAVDVESVDMGIVPGTDNQRGCLSAFWGDMLAI